MSEKKQQKMMHHLAALQQCYMDRLADTRMYKTMFFHDVKELESGKLYDEKRDFERLVNRYAHLRRLVMYSSAVDTDYFRVYFVNCNYQGSSYARSTDGLAEERTVADRESFDRLNRELRQWRAENGTAESDDDESHDDKKTEKRLIKKPKKYK